jgi:hypothetical protein
MKKISLILFFTLVVFIAKSQKSYFGVDAGVNVANQRATLPSGFYGNVIGSRSSFFDNLIAPTFSVFYQYNISNVLGIRANARYQGLGYHLAESTSYAFIRNYNVTINYLTIPLSVHYSINSRLSVNGGAYVSFRVGGKDWSNQEITKTYHKNDFGFSVGSEYAIYKSFSISLSYIIGAKNIWLNDQGGDYIRTNRALQIALIYKFKKQTTNNQ